VEEIITKAVIATRLSCTREPKDAFKATEKRLYAYPLLKAKIEDDKEQLEEIRNYGVRSRSKSITRFMKSGVRLDTEDIKQAVIIDLTASIAADQHEVERIEKALEQIQGGDYTDIIRLKYFEQKTDEEIADELHCAPRTVRTHKSTLVGRLSVFLYGAGALA
jgi:RNA polymerase sigma factor (sigma-70 family)